MQDNKKMDKIIISINLVSILLSFLIFYFTRNLIYAAVFEIVGLFVSIIYKEYDNQKKIKEHKIKEQEYTNLFISINNYRNISKDLLLEFDLPYELRMLVQKSTFNKVDYQEYTNLLTDDFSLNYKKMMMGFYFLIEEKRTDEWDKIFLDFIKETKKNNDMDFLKERKSKEISCFAVLLLLILIILIFLFPTFKELIYGAK